MRKSTLLFLEMWDLFWFEVRWAVRKDIRRLVAMLKPIVDVESGAKLYLDVEASRDHDTSQYCMFCDSIQPVYIVTTTRPVTNVGGDKGDAFCKTCGYELVAYDMESENE